MISPESSRVQLLPIICSAMGAVILVIVLITIAIISAFYMRQKKRNEGMKCIALYLFILF